MRFLSIAMLCCFVGCGGGSGGADALVAAAVDKDSDGKVPADYAKAYYEAINKDDIEAIKAMCSEGYYTSIVTKRGFLKEPDESLFAKQMERRMHKTTSVTETKSGFFTPPNAKGVYSYCAKIVFTDAYKPVFKERVGIDTANMNDEVCFKLDKGLWRITDKMEGF